MKPLRMAPNFVRLVLCSQLAFWALPPTAHALSGAYRVELLVFSHTGTEPVPEETEVLQHFPGAWRLFEERAVVYPDDPAPLGVMSDLMRSTWRRLERSAEHQPLYMQSWEQSRFDYHPPVRIHNDQVILERINLPERWVDIDLTTPDLFSAYRETYFRLDGTAQLRRSRFLHLEFDLEFRLELLTPDPVDQDPVDQDPVELPEPIRTEEPVSSAPSAIPGLTLELPLETEVEKPLPNWNAPLPLIAPTRDPNPPVPGARLYRLQESRQIRTGQVQYFDTPYLGVIARVTQTAGE